MSTSAGQMEREWLEADGLGGFASGTVSGIRTRRYHALLLHASSPPTGRMVLVGGLEAWLETPNRTLALSSQRYHPDVVHPDGCSRVVEFIAEPWPTWRFRIDDGVEIKHEILARHGTSEMMVRWSASRPGAALRLNVRPLLCGRDYHALHRENPGFRFDAEVDGATVTWRPYPGVPGIQALTNADYEHAPDWYRSFQYTEEQQRGLDCIEDLASPGVFTWDLAKEDAVLVLRAVSVGRNAVSKPVDPNEYALEFTSAERERRASFASVLDRSADAYIVRRGSGKTIVAGYPWFTDWGRDTFIALRGLCTARGDFDTARDILLEWAATVSEGMLPNRFPDGGETPEYNSVDASLWYVVAVYEVLEAAKRGECKLTAIHRRALQAACEAIVEGYARGTRFGIRMDVDGLLAAGVPGVQLTWMDAKVGDWVVTPRIGKPIEVQALWCNALRIVGEWSPPWRPAHLQAVAAVRARFWREDAKCLYDVVDVDHAPGRADAAFRPNQILAVGGLPFPVFDGPQARAIVDAVEAQLLTPLGLRSLSPNDPSYRARYEGGVVERDSAYHQGTVWCWLVGPFVEAWLRVRGSTSDAKTEAARRFLEPLREHLKTAGIGHISEIADAEAPFTPRGCPFQAWSLGEFIRADRLVSGYGTPDTQLPNGSRGRRPAASRR